MSGDPIKSTEDVVSSHTIGRLEILGRVLGRRRSAVKQKLANLRDVFGSDGSVRAAVERHEVGGRLRLGPE